MDGWWSVVGVTGSEWMMDAMMDALRCDALALRGGRFSGAWGRVLAETDPLFRPLRAAGPTVPVSSGPPACCQPCLLFSFFHPTGNFQVLAFRCDAFSTPEMTNSLKTHQHRLGLCEDESCLPSPLLKSFGNNPAQRGCTTGPGPGSTSAARSGYPPAP
jgi:hypothetical protein